MGPEPGADGFVAYAAHMARAQQAYMAAMGRQAAAHEAFLAASQRGFAALAPAAAPGLDLAAVRDHWRRRLGVARWPLEDLFMALGDQFLGAVTFADPAGLARLEGRGVLYLANHQVGVESLLFSLVASWLGGVPTAALSRAEHRTGWIGQLVAHAFAYPGLHDPGLVVYFDRQDRASLFGLLDGLKADAAAGRKSLLVHVEGELGERCGAPVTRLSALFLDMAIEAGLPIVPVRFAGGLPTTPLAQALEFPLGYGRQTWHLGAAIAPEALKALPYADRKRYVLERLNGLGPPLAQERPAPPDADFARGVATRMAHGLPEPQAVLLEALARRRDLGPEAAALMRASRGGPLEAPDSPSGRWLAGVARWLGEGHGASPVTGPRPPR